MFCALNHNNHKQFSRHCTLHGRDNPIFINPLVQSSHDESLQITITWFLYLHTGLFFAMITKQIYILNPL